MLKSANIRSRLTLMLLVFGCLPLIVVTSAGYLTLRDAALKDTGNHMQQIATQTVERFSELIFYTRESVRSWANSGLSQGAGQLDSTNSLHEALQANFESFGIFSAIVVTDEQGTIISGNSLELVGLSLANSPWWDSVDFSAGGVAPLTFEPIAGGFVIPVIEPLRDGETSQARGYVVGFLAWSELLDLAAGVDLGTDSGSPKNFVVLIDEQGLAVAGPDFALLNPNKPEVSDAVSNVNFRELGYASASLAIQGASGSLVDKLNLNGNFSEAVVGYANASTQRRAIPLAWSALAIQDSSLAFAPIVELRNLAIGFALVVAAIAAMLAHLAARKISNPIIQLTRHALEVAGGDLGKTIDIPSRDEIGDLSKAFNKLSMDMRDNIDQLHRSLDMARSSEKAKSEFLATMSHEIRTPLNGVLGMAELLRDTDLEPDQQHLVDVINSSGTTLLDIINDILDFSKIEAGELALETIEFDLCRTLEDICQLYSVVANSRGLELVCNIPPEVSMVVQGDLVRLRQVLSNLVNNACKFTDQGTVELTVDLLEVAEQQGSFRITVQDSGIGIAQDELNSIFESFKQANSSTTRTHGGTGLGLAISKKLIELMHGTLHVTSTQGVGSTFSVELKLPIIKDLSNELADSSMANLRVLVVDDTPTNLVIIERQLLSWGVQCHTFSNAEAALSALRISSEAGKAFDMVISDYHMPVADGLEFSRRIRQDPELRSVPIVILSSGAGVVDKSEVDSLRIDAWLPKPLRREDLRNVLLRLTRQDPPKEKEVVKQTSFVPLDARVLVAEDNPVNQLVIRKMLESFGCVVTIANNGVEAVEIASSGSFDVILMDYFMPEMDGLAATRKIRNDGSPALQSIPIIALTANAVQRDREDCLDAGMNDYLSKPIRRDKLYATLREWTSEVVGH